MAHVNNEVVCRTPPEHDEYKSSDATATRPQAAKAATATANPKAKIDDDSDDDSDSSSNNKERLNQKVHLANENNFLMEREIKMLE